MERKTSPVTENAKARLKEEQQHHSLWKPKCRRCIFSLLCFARDNSKYMGTISLGAMVAEMKIRRTSATL